MMDEYGAPQFGQGVVVTSPTAQAEREIAFAYHDFPTGLAEPGHVPGGQRSCRARDGTRPRARSRTGPDNFNWSRQLGHDVPAMSCCVRWFGRLRRSPRANGSPGRGEYPIPLADLEVTPEDARAETRNSALLAAEGLARRIQDSLRVPFVLEGDEVYVSASIGVSVFPIDAEDGSSLLKNADVAMYRSKRERPGGCMIFAEEARQNLPDLSFATRLRGRVEAKQWVLHHQPIVDSKVNAARRRGVAALAGPRKGAIYPNDSSRRRGAGLIGTIGNGCFKSARRAGGQI